MRGNDLVAHIINLEFHRCRFSPPPFKCCFKFFMKSDSPTRPDLFQSRICQPDQNHEDFKGHVDRSNRVTLILQHTLERLGESSHCFSGAIQLYSVWKLEFFMFVVQWQILTSAVGSGHSNFHMQALFCKYLRWEASEESHSCHGTSGFCWWVWQATHMETGSAGPALSR